jgi:cation-transporting ATPase 13A3/4/5
MKRLREISRFECDVRVLRNSFCKLYFWPSFAFQQLTNVGRYIPSSELVPGDVYEVTDPALTQFPCDSILLAGDCIVNESMLTGKNNSWAAPNKYLQ